MIKQFFKPISLEEALMLKETHGDSIAWFAGGTHINHVDFKVRFEKVISLKGLGLHSIHTKNNQISIGASATLQKICDNSTIPMSLRVAAYKAAPRSIRNMATIGGDIASGGKKSMLIPTLLSLQALVKVRKAETLTIADYIKEGSKDLITSILIPKLPLRTFTKTVRLKGNGPALLTTAASITLRTDGTPKEVIVAIGTIEEESRRLTRVEELVVNTHNLERKTIEDAVKQDLSPVEDLLGSVPYKKHIAAVTIAECIYNCLKRG